MIVTLCGSTRFTRWFQAWNRALSLAGHCVFSLSAYPTDAPFAAEAGVSGVKEKLDETHKKKIAASQAVVLLNPYAYIGESTLRELEYASTLGVRIYAIESWGRGHGITAAHYDHVRRAAKMLGVPDGFVSPVSTCDYGFAMNLLGDAGPLRSALVAMVEEPMKVLQQQAAEDLERDRQLDQLMCGPEPELEPKHESTVEPKKTPPRALHPTRLDPFSRRLIELQRRAQAAEIARLWGKGSAVTLQRAYTDGVPRVAHTTWIAEVTLVGADTKAFAWGRSQRDALRNLLTVLRDHARAEEHYRPALEMAASLGPINVGGGLLEIGYGRGLLEIGYGRGRTVLYVASTEAAVEAYRRVDRSVYHARPVDVVDCSALENEPVRYAPAPKNGGIVLRDRSAS